MQTTKRGSYSSNGFFHAASVLLLAAGALTTGCAPDGGGDGPVALGAEPARTASEIAPFFPYMAWHQGNKDGFSDAQLALLASQPYQFVVIPKMHRENVVPAESYYTSLANAVTELHPHQANVWGYFNAHDYFSRYALPGFDAAHFSSAYACGTSCDAEDVQRTYDANSTAAHDYVDAALQHILDAGANGVYVDYSWGASGLGVLAPYIVHKASELFGDNIVVNQKSQANAALVSSHLFGPSSTWYAHIEKAGPEFFPCSQRPEMCTVATVNTLGSYLRANMGDLHLQGIVLTSQTCSETDPSTWTYIDDYRKAGDACQDPEGCVFECNAGYCCDDNGCGDC